MVTNFTKRSCKLHFIERQEHILIQDLICVKRLNRECPGSDFMFTLVGK